MMRLESSTPPSSASPKSRVKLGSSPWRGVIAAITTPFDTDGSVDYPALADHCRWLLRYGVRGPHEVGSDLAGLLPAGELGEGDVLSHKEKRLIFETCVGAVRGRAPIFPRIAAASTSDAIALARHAQAVGCQGLMVAPPYGFDDDWPEIRAHLSAILSATDLPCALYNHRPPHRVRYTPEHIEELANAFPNLQAVKEPYIDAQRSTALQRRLGDRLEIVTCVEDAVVEAIDAGATGWVACMVNAFPAESIALYRYAIEGRKNEASELLRWFLPLLRMNANPQFVQLIKLAQERVGRGSSRVRPPRLPLEGETLQQALDLLDTALRARPDISM